VLAHVLEQHGIATVQLASIRSYVERIRPPRALYCEFPLGRPLGRPDDATFQRRVLEAAFALLERPSGPVLEDFPEAIADEPSHSLACPVPPQSNPDLPAAVDEAIGLRAAYERQQTRSGRTTVGYVVGPDGIPDAVAAIVRIADGVPLDDADLPGSAREVALDIRAYYEEAALALADHVPQARQAEAWFFRETAAGASLKRAQAAMRDAGVAQGEWVFMVPVSQQGD
jgi:hypothetical protein